MGIAVMIIRIDPDFLNKKIAKKAQIVKILNQSLLLRFIVTNRIKIMISFVLFSLLQSLFWVVSFSIDSVMIDPSKLTSFSVDFKFIFQSSKASQSVAKMAHNLFNSNSLFEVTSGALNQSAGKRVIYYKFNYGSECLSETTMTVGVMEGICFQDVDLSFTIHASGCAF
jgi:hypothetical protein